MKILLKSVATLSVILLLQSCHHTPHALKGLPSLDQPWTGKEYQTTILELNKRRQPLPRYNSKAGTILLKKFTDEENLEIFEDQKVPLDERIGNYFMINQNLGVLIEQYAVLTEVDPHINRELTELITFALKSATKGMTLADEILKVTKTEKKANANKLYGGIMGMYEGAEEFLLRNRALQPEYRTTLLEGMSETLPQLNKAFSPHYKAKLRNHLALYLNTFKDKSDQKMIMKMINLLR